MATAETYKLWENWLQIADIVRNVLRFVVFNFHKLLYKLALHIAEAFHKITKLSLLDNEALNSTYNKSLIIGISLLLIGIIYLGYKYLFREQDHRKNFNNLIISVAILTGMTLFMSNVSSLVNSITATYSQTGMKNSVDNAFKQAFFDISKPDEDKFSKSPDSYNPRIDLSAEDLTYIDINSKISEPKSEVLKSKFDGKKVDKVHIGTIIHFDDELYYQFGYSPLTSFISLLVLNVVFILSGFKIVKQLIELVFMKIISPLIAGLDIANGQTMKKLLQEIIKGYALIVFIFIVVEIYVALMGVATTLYNLDLKRAYSVDLIVYLIFIIASAYFVIDGPKTVEKLIGIDTGLTTEGKRASVIMGFIASKLANSFGDKQGNSKYDSTNNGDTSLSQNTNDNSSMYYDSQSNSQVGNNKSSVSNSDNQNRNDITFEESSYDSNESTNFSNSNPDKGSYSENSSNEPEKGINYDGDRGTYISSNGGTHEQDTGMYYDNEKGSYSLTNNNNTHNENSMNNSNYNSIDNSTNDSNYNSSNNSNANISNDNKDMSMYYDEE